MRILLILFLIPCIISSAFAQSVQILPTEKGTLDIELSTTPNKLKPGDSAKININFINPSTQKIQEHIDYKLTVFNDGTAIFGPIPLTHTSVGSVSIPVEFKTEGTYDVRLEIEGILFQPIPLEMVSFSIIVGKESKLIIDDTGGGCLIATATYGSELAPQVQQLRQVRDNVILETESGFAFMSAFNQLYYSFSPTVADFERENFIFKEIIKMALVPLLMTLSIFNYIEIDSEEDMLMYGISVTLLNLGIYMGTPAFLILKLWQFKRNHNRYLQK